MLLQSFQITGSAVAQILLLAAIGFFLVKKEILGPAGLDALSRLVIEVVFPVLIFCQLLKDFSFSLYADWWIFPLISIVITAIGLFLGFLLMGFVRGGQEKLQFVNLVGFQNAGYLPLALIAALLPTDQKDVLFIYLFLFLLGFNLVMFSLGVYLLTFHQNKKFALGSLFSPPVAATLISLLVIFFGLNKFIPQTVMKPLGMVGECALPLAMFVVGGNLAQINLGKIKKKEMALVLLAKLIILPAIGLWLVLVLQPPSPLGLLILIQLAMPCATTLSVIIRHFKKQDLLISQGIFLSHVASIVTIPVFLSLYFTLVMLK